MMDDKLLNNIKYVYQKIMEVAYVNKNGKGSAVRLAIYTGLW